MELYFMATGVKHELDYFENQMQFMQFLLPFKDKDGKEFKQPLYGGLEPIQLYRFIFPKEHLNEVLKTLDLPSEAYGEFDKQAFALRKILRAKPIPKVPKDTRARLFHRGNIAIKGIGIKEDREQTFDNGCTHEAI